MTTTEAPEICNFQWKDGWGEHTCWMIADHERHYHACMCDQTTPVTREKT